jgi:hypothetical protein
LPNDLVRPVGFLKQNLHCRRTSRLVDNAACAGGRPSGAGAKGQGR